MTFPMKFPMKIALPGFRIYHTVFNVKFHLSKTKFPMSSTPFSEELIMVSCGFSIAS